MINDYNYYLFNIKIESIGTDRFEKITELEILFTTFDEIASLNNFSNLRKLSCKLQFQDNT